MYLEAFGAFPVLRRAKPEPGLSVLSSKLETRPGPLDHRSFALLRRAAPARPSPDRLFQLRTSRVNPARPVHSEES